MSDSTFSCGLDAALAVAGGRWKPSILHHLAKGSLRYGELRRAVGAVTDKVLIQQLKELAADGIVTREDHREVPPRVDYALTPFGVSLARALASLCRWGEENEASIKKIVRRRRRATVQA